LRERADQPDEATEDVADGMAVARSRSRTQAGREAAKAVLAAGQGIGRAKAAWRRAATPYTGLRFHDLRHQAITELAEAGAQDFVIQSIAGHLSKRMLDNYSHIRRAAKRDATDKLSGGLTNPAPAVEQKKSVAVN
jgi:integrase